MRDDEREPGAERPEGSESPSPPPDAIPRSARDEAPAEAPAAAEAWPSQPAADTTETSEWPTAPRDHEPPPGEVEAYAGGGGETRDEAHAATAPAPAAPTGAHSVPSTEGVTGESTQCPRCGTENRPGLAFCRSCGQRLMTAGVSSTLERPGTPDGSMACPRCGTHNRAGVAFCQNCGANLRGVGVGYVPPAVAVPEGEVTVGTERRGALLGPIVMLIGLIGLITGYLLPFEFGSENSLWERASGSDGYGLSFWSGYPEVGAGLTDQIYFGLAAPVPLLALLVGALIVAGFLRARPGAIQTIGLAITLAWCVGLAVLFVIVELVGNWNGDLVPLLSAMSPAGIIFLLSSLILVIGALTRFGRS